MSKAFWVGVFKSRTMWLGHAVAVFGIVTGAYPDLLTREQMSLAACTIAVLTYVARIHTDSSLADK